jgi:AcrR family transcriptional regulator
VSTVDHTPRRRENTRAKLLEAALDVFAEKGLDGATVDDLVQAAGFTRGAFYSNFASLEDVFFAVFEQQSARMVSLVRDVVAETPDDRFGLDVVGVILDRLWPHSRQWYLLQTEYLLYALRHQDAAASFAQQRSRFEGEFATVLGQVLERLGRVPTIPTPQLAKIIASLYLGLLAEESLAQPQHGELLASRFTGEVLPGVLDALSVPR